MLFLREKGIVPRERTPVGVMAWAVYEYLIAVTLRRARDRRRIQSRQGPIGVLPAESYLTALNVGGDSEPQALRPSRRRAPRPRRVRRRAGLDAGAAGSVTW